MSILGVSGLFASNSRLCLGVGLLGFKLCLKSAGEGLSVLRTHTWHFCLVAESALRTFPWQFCLGAECGLRVHTWKFCLGAESALEAGHSAKSMDTRF